VIAHRRSLAARLPALRRSLLVVSTVASLIAVSGCHSAYVQTTVTNLGPPIRTVELDYPSQSFGTTILTTNQVFHYRFKVQGEGPVKIQYTDSANKQQTATGPLLHEGAEGSLAVIIQPDGKVEWKPDAGLSSKQ